MLDLLETHQEFHANFAEFELACRSMFNATELDKCHQKLGRQQTSSLKSQVHPKGYKQSKLRCFQAVEMFQFENFES